MRIHLHLEKGHPERAQLLVDDVDLTRATLASSLRADLDNMAPTITLTLRPDVLELTGDLETTLRRGTCGSHHPTEGEPCVLPPDHRLPHSNGDSYWSK